MNTRILVAGRLRPQQALLNVVEGGRRHVYINNVSRSRGRAPNGGAARDAAFKAAIAHEERPRL